MILIDGKSLTLENILEVALRDRKVGVAEKAKAAILNSRKFIESKLTGSEAIYGVNTGFGLLSRVRIDPNMLDQLQVNIIRSHSVGIGAPLSQAEVRAAILLRANTLATGNSGVTLEVIEALIAMLNANVHPWIPCQGSVGASGDLAPLSHLALTLMGEGQAYFKNELMDSAKALILAGLKPYRLKPKEGLSLINGTQIMTAIGALAFAKAKELAVMADVAGAMTIEALQGSAVPFDERISRLRPHPGQIECAAHMRALLSDSEIMKAHKDCDKVQDPYSLRCIPQVHGVARDALNTCEKILNIEINSVTDNPLVFADDGVILNGGNFHGEYIGVAFDTLAISIHELGNISEQRMEKLINPAMSGLPAFLAKKEGLNSGFMIVQVAAASLVSENKIYCHPASVDSIPTSADKEDHVSMGTIAARKFRTILDNTWNVIAMEFLCAAQGLEFQKPLNPGPQVLKAYQAIRSVSPPVEEDRAFYLDVQKIVQLMHTGALII